MSRELVQWEVWTKILAGKPDLEPLQIPRVADNGRGYISNFGYKHLYLSLDLDFLKKKKWSGSVSSTIFQKELAHFKKTYCVTYVNGGHSMSKFLIS